MRWLRRSKPESTGETLDETMAEAADTFVEFGRKLGWAFDFSARSITDLDALIERLASTGDPINPSLEVIMASYYGETHRRLLGGTWKAVTDTSGEVITSDGRHVEAHSDVRMRIANGSTGSLTRHLQDVRSP
jgi:hypothetical protein